MTETTHRHIFNKAEWRLRNVSFISGVFQTETGLPGPYVETVGRSGEDSYSDMSHFLHYPSDFVAVDFNKDVARYHRLNNVPFRVVVGSINHVCNSLIHERTPPCTINYDLYKTAAHDGWWKGSGRSLRCFRDASLDSYGAFALITNHTLDEVIPRESSSSRARRHLEIASKHLGRVIGVSDSFFKELDNRKFTGVEGPVDVYRSKKLRMTTLRLAWPVREV